MNSILELLAGSWFALGLLKSSAIALIGGAFIFCLRQRDLAAGLWPGLALLLSLAFFSGQLSLSWKALPPVVEAPAQATPGTNLHPQMATTPATETEMPEETPQSARGQHVGDKTNEESHPEKAIQESHASEGKGKDTTTT